MVNGNVISSLEQSLQQIQQLLSQKKGRLREIEREASELHAEVNKLKDGEEQIKRMMRDLLDGGGSGQSRKAAPSRAHELDLDLSDYDDVYDDVDEEDIIPRYPQPKRNSNNYQNNNYSQRSVVPMHRSNNSGGNRSDIPSTNPDVEVRSYRFRDRTIASACTILMREYGRPLHVNEIYNRLLEGGMTFTGNNPTISIAVSLNRNRRFRKVAPGTFDLVMRDASQAAS